MQMFKFVRRHQVLIPAAALLQLTACLGPDPQLFITSSVANAVLANLVTFVFAALTGGVA